MDSNNPTQKKVYTLFLPLVELIQTYERTADPVLPPEDSRLKLNTVVSKMSLFYEKLRNAVDYEEEHLLRERAIVRNLRRTMTLSGRSGVGIAKPLIYDLIRAGYLPNNALPETLITQTEVVIDRYISLVNHIGKYKSKEEKVLLFSWLLNMMAVELDDLFQGKERDNALVECMYQVVRKDIVVADTRYSELDKKIQLYLAILSSLMKADEARLSFYLWQLYVPQWNGLSDEGIIKVAQGISDLYDKIQRQVTHPLSDLYGRILRKYDVLFLIIRDIVNEYPHNALEIWKKPSLLEDKIRQAAKKRYRVSRIKLTRSIIRSIIYLFITKMILAVLLEFPLDLMLERTVNYTNIIINVLFPPLLMFIIGLFIRVPGIKNTDKIVQGIKEISYQFEDRHVIHKIKKPLKRSVLMTRAFRAVYAVIFTFTFFLIVYGLDRLHFNIASMVIFIFFLSLVSFFSVRISQSARELHILEKKDNLFTFIKDFFSLPILQFGRWLSDRVLSKINFFVIFFDFIIEAPFKVLVDGLEEWFGYVKEKKEEIY